jgi:hypothetical protein
MPSPEVEIKTTNIESPKREIKELWLAENPGMGSAEFETYREQPEFKSWAQDINDWTAVTRDYWADQSLQTVTLQDLDQKLKILRTFSDTGGQSKLVYDKLINRFGDSEFFGANNPAWKLPDAARVEWRTLTDKKQAQVQHSAQDLSSVILRARVLANEEMSGANVNVPDATKSALKSALENIESALKQWDKLLSGSASPDRQELRKAANELSNRLNEFTNAHAKLFAANTTPYIKYEVLAVVKAVSEKVASQFSARVTEPDVTGMYSRIIDVPRSTPKKVATEAGKEISSHYRGDLKTFWAVTMGNLHQTAGRSRDLPNLRLELQTAIYKTSNQHPIADSLKAFSDSYQAVRPDTLNWIHGLSSSVAEITFRIPKYQDAIEHVFANYADNASARQVRDQYRKLFDTVTQYTQNRVEVLEQTLR